MVGRQRCTSTHLLPDTRHRFGARFILMLLLPWDRRAFARVLRMTGAVSLPRMFIAHLLPGSCAPAPLLLHAMSFHRSGSCVVLRVHLCNVRPQSVPMQDLPAMPTLTLFELARLPVWVFCAMVPLMLFHASPSVAPSAELAFSILRRRRFHFPTGTDSGFAHN